MKAQMTSRRLGFAAAILGLLLGAGPAIAQDVLPFPSPPMGGKGWDSNWLPAPDGPFYMVMRLYGPEAAALDGTWTPPPVKPAD